MTKENEQICTCGHDEGLHVYGGIRSCGKTGGVYSCGCTGWNPAPAKCPFPPIEEIEKSKVTDLTGDEDFDEILKQCVETLSSKGEDYTIGTGDRLFNFKSVGHALGLTPAQVLMTYFYKHVTAVLNYVKSEGKSESEPIEGRIVDVINYMLLFAKMVREKKNFEKHVTDLVRQCKEPLQRAEDLIQKQRQVFHHSPGMISVELGANRKCDDCGYITSEDELITKGDHRGGDKTVCRDRDLCHSRGG